MDAETRRFIFAYDSALPLDPCVRSDACAEGSRRASLTYRSANNERVPAVLSLPDRLDPAPALVIQHGGNRSKDERLIQGAMRRWTAAGYACLAIDAPDHGERAATPGAGEAPWRRLPFRQRDNRVQNVIDLRRGIDFLETLPQVDAGRLGYWGISMGASVGVQLMAVDERVRAGCFALGGGGFRRVPEGLSAREAALLRQVMDPTFFAPDIAPRPVLMLNGLEDETIGRDATEALYGVLGEPRELRWFRAGHRVTPGMLRASLEFFAGSLRPA